MNTFRSLEVTDANSPIQNLPGLEGQIISLKEMDPALYNRRQTYTFDSKGNKVSIQDASFGFLQNSLAKLHENPYQPKTFFTYLDDIVPDYGGGLVDFTEYYDIDYRGILNNNLNMGGNSMSDIPRANVSMSQNYGKVFTYEMAYDIKMIDLEKMTKLRVQKAIEQIYRDVITVGWDAYCQRIAYFGISSTGTTGLFNSDKVKTHALPLNAGEKFTDLTNQEIIDLINSITTEYLVEFGNNYNVVPTRILLPTDDYAALVSRTTDLLNTTLLEFIKLHSLSTQLTGKPLEIAPRPQLTGAGTGGKDRIVAYIKESDYVRMDIPYPLQQYLTIPNPSTFSYSTYFVGQAAQLVTPYDSNSAEAGSISYWDFV